MRGKKWPFSFDGEEEKKKTKKKNETNKSDEKEVVFDFKLSQNHSLKVRKGDVDYLKAIVSASQFDLLSPKTVFSALQGNSNGAGMITNENFLLSIAYLLETVDEEDGTKDFVLDCVNVLFQLVLRATYGVQNLGQNDEVKINDLLGLVLLCQGSKSPKLAFSWGLIDADEDSRITRKELFVLFRSFLLGLFAFNFQCGLPLSTMVDIAEEASTEIAARFFIGSRRKEKETISFDEFAEFYGEGEGKNKERKKERK